MSVQKRKRAVMPQVRGYILGRLFALLATQGALEQAPEQLYHLASTAPPQVIPKALATMIEAGKEEMLFPFMQQLPLEAFDGPLNRREQGAFAMGYVHERAGYLAPILEDDSDEEGQELTERYEFRVDPRLKEWIKTNGGGMLIRTLLRAERTKTAQQVAQPPEGGEQSPL
jgi:hypothetical protein